MKFGIDLDGTLDARPWLFNQMMREWISNGHEVIVVTGTFEGPALCSIEDKERQLSRQATKDAGTNVSFLRNIHYTDIVLVVGEGATPEEMFKGVYRLKGEACHERKIDMFFENDHLAAWEVKRRAPHTQVVQML